MKQKSKICLIMLLCALLVTSVALTACGSPYTLTFETNGGTTIEPISFKAGGKVTAPTTTKDLFTFDGWYEDSKLTTPFEQFNSMPDRDVTVYARWKGGESGRIVFDSMGGSAVNDVTGIVGQGVSQPSNPTKEGYNFVAWYRDASYTSLYVFGTPMTSGTLTLYARWSKDTSNYFYLTYVLNGVATEVPVSIDEKATVPDVPQDTTCIWYRDKNFTNEYDFESVVDRDRTLYGLMYSNGLTFDGNAVTGYNGASSIVYIPEKHNGNVITTVGAGAFEGNNSVNYVNLPETIATIADTAFYKCEYLVALNVYQCQNAAYAEIDGKVTTVGNLAFAECLRMVSTIDLSGLTEIADGAFANCSLLSEVNLGSELVKIGENAFINCSSLSTIDLPNSVEQIGDYALANCGITALTIPYSLAEWGTGAVKGSTKLASITGGNGKFVVDSEKGTLIQGKTLLVYVTTASNTDTTEYTPQEITAVAPYAFYGNATIEKLDFSGGVELTKSSLEGMTALESLTVTGLDSGSPYLAYWFGASSPKANGSTGLYVPKSLVAVTFTGYSLDEIADYAFYGCNGLKQINGIDEITSVGEYSFGYTAITSFNITSGVTRVDKAAFRGASQLAEITVDGQNAAYSAHEGALYDITGDTLIYLPESKTQFTFNPTATVIGEGAMYRSTLTELVVPSDIVQIGFGAFENMTHLRSLTVPFIGGSADSNRYMLYVFGATITDDDNGRKVVSGEKCPASLNSITVTVGLDKVPDYAFAYCSTVSQFNIGDNDYTTIGINAFSNTGFTSLVIPDAVSVIEEYAFYGCERLTSIVIGKGVTTIKTSAFAGMSTVESIVFKEGENDLEIGDYAFRAALSVSNNSVTAAYSRLSNLELSNNVVSIGEDAFGFAGHYGTLNSSTATTYYFRLVLDSEKSRLRTIGNFAFRYGGVYKVDLPSTIQSIGSYAFAGNVALTSFTVRKTITTDNLSEIPRLGGFVFTDTPNVTIYVPQVSVEYYKTSWSSDSSVDTAKIAAIEEA